METPKTIEERREDVINGPFGINLKGQGFSCFHQDVNRPDMDPTLLYFDLTRKAEVLTASKVGQIEADAIKLAEELGITVHKVTKWFGKAGDFHNSQTQIQISVYV